MVTHAGETTTGATAIGFAIQESQEGLESSPQDPSTAELNLLRAENKRLREENAVSEEKYRQAREEIDDLRLELEIVKSQLARYQKIECAQLAQRRQAALAEHRRRYELQHGLPPGSSDQGRVTSDGVEEDGDDDGDYDTID